MLLISVASHQAGYSPGMPSVWSGFSHGLTRVRNIPKPERTGESFRELADESLMFAFGESQPSGNLRAFHTPRNAKKANNSSSSHVEQITSAKNTFLLRASSNFKTQSLLPISAEKTGNSISNKREQNVGSDVVWDKLGSDKVDEKTDNANHKKSIYPSIQRSSTAYRKGTYKSVPKNGCTLAPKKSSGDNDIIGRITALLASFKNKNPENENSCNSNSKFENRDHPTRSVWHQYNEKTKDEFKEDASRRHYNHFPNSKIEIRNSPNKSVWRQNSGRTEVSKEDRSRIQSSMEQKVPMRKFNSKRGAQNIKYVKKSKIMDNSLSEAFLLSRPPSNFVRRSPIPSVAIKQDVRPVPGMKESKSSFSEKKSSGQDEDILQDSEEMLTSAENGSFVRDSSCLSEDKLNVSTPLKLVELKIDGSKLRDLEGTPTALENGSVCRVLPSLSEDKSCDLSELKHGELKKIAKSYGLKGYSNLKKAEILELLRNFRQS